MALTKKDRQQLLGFLIVLGLAAPVVFWMYWRTPKVAEADDLQRRIDSLENQVRVARADLREGSVESLRRRVDAYERSLGLMRQLVPTENEVTNLIDEVSTRAQLRGVQITDLSPLPVEIEVPFEVYRYRFTVQGLYDQLGEFLADVASLPRIMVPYDLSLQVANVVVSEEADEEEGTYLTATFVLRTFVKSESVVVGGAGGTS